MESDLNWVTVAIQEAICCRAGLLQIMEIRSSEQSMSYGCVASGKGLT